MKKVFGNIPAIPFAIFIAIAIFGIVFATFFSNYAIITGYAPSPPAALECIRADPDISISPLSQAGTAGQTLNYTLFVKNNDENCISTTFNLVLSMALEAPLTGILDNSTITVPSGQTNSTTLRVTSSPTATIENYPFYVERGSLYHNSKTIIFWDAYNITTSIECISAGSVSKNPSMGPSGYFGECCEGLVELLGAPFAAYHPENCSMKLGYVGAGYICSDCGNAICEAWEHECNCPQDCKSENATVTMSAPEHGKNISAPGSITFKWTPKNFENTKPFCVPFALISDKTSWIIPKDAVKCENDKKCEWTFDDLNASHKGEWQWMVGCSNNESNFIDEDWPNTTFSDIWSFEIIAENITTKIDLVAPFDNKTYVAPISIPFQWIPKGFATPVCIPVAAINDEFLLYPGSWLNKTIFIKCANNKTCNWTTPELDNEYVGNWQWIVYCGNSENDFETENIMSSSIRNFEIKSLTGCVPNWTVTEWQPASCEPNEIQSRILTDKSNCKIRPPTINCSSWDQENSICIEKRSCLKLLPSGLTLISNWEPCPCEEGEQQYAIFLYPDGTNLTQYRDCINENWVVKWDKCANGTQTGTWFDKNEADTECGKPTEIPQRACVAFEKLVPLILICVGIIIIIIFATLFIKKRSYVKAAKKIREVREAEKPEAKKPQEYSELKGYIKKAQAKGFSKEKMKQQLIKAGWPDDVVDKALP